MLQDLLQFRGEDRSRYQRPKCVSVELKILLLVIHPKEKYLASPQIYVQECLLQIVEIISESSWRILTVRGKRYNIFIKWKNQIAKQHITNFTRNLKSMYIFMWLKGYMYHNVISCLSWIGGIFFYDYFFLFILLYISN